MQYAPISDLVEKALSEILSPVEGIMIPTMPKLSLFLGGLRPHEVTILCAGTGAGKTSLLASIAAELVKQGIPTMVAPVETGDTDFTTRVISALAERDLNDGLPKTVEELGPGIHKILDTLRDAPLYITNYDNRVEIEELKSVLEFASNRDGVRVVMLDNLNFFLKVTSSTMEKAEMDSAIHELVMFAKRFPIHTILICHPRKTENGRVVSEYDIKGSSTAVQECANVLLFNRVTDEDIGLGYRPNDREFVFRKIRKRGAYVGSKIFMRYECGSYGEVQDVI